MRVLFIVLGTLCFAPLAHAGVKADVAAMRTKVQKGYSSAALERFDRGVRIGTPKSGGTEADLSGGNGSRMNLRDESGHSITHEKNPTLEASYASRLSGESTILRQPGATISGKQLTISDTVTKLSPNGAKTEGVLYKERSLLGKLLRVESTTRYRADVDSEQRSTTRIVSDKRRLVVGGVKIPLPANGAKQIATMYGK